MAVRLDARDPGFEAQFRRLLAMKGEVLEDVDRVAKDIIDDVVANGDAALVAHTERLDGFKVSAATLRIADDEIAAARRTVSKDELDALGLAKERIETYHRRQRPSDESFIDPLGVEMGWRWTAMEAVGLYVPGGKASYPSSLLMNAVPAKVAGVPRIAMAVPTPKGEINPLVLVASELVGIDEIYRVGGAQAIAALAYGTASIAPVVKIVGPGNAYVAAAKRRVFGKVGIDMIAGPSEVVIVADASGNADWIAADLLAQAEHDEAAQAILITDEEALADRVAASLAGQLKQLPRAAIAGRSWSDNGAIIVVKALDDAVGLIDRLAPEHLEIEATDAEALAKKVRNAGAIFLGAHTPEAVGDYIGGPNHVLPTARSARFSSGLGVLDFMKRTSILKCDAGALAALGPAAVTLAEAEGLTAHARSISIRLNR